MPKAQYGVGIDEGIVRDEKYWPGHEAWIGRQVLRAMRDSLAEGFGDTIEVMFLEKYIKLSTRRKKRKTP